MVIVSGLSALLSVVLILIPFISIILLVVNSCLSTIILDVATKGKFDPRRRSDDRKSTILMWCLIIAELVGFWVVVIVTALCS